MDTDLQANRQKIVVAYICYAPPDEPIARRIVQHWAILTRTKGIKFTGAFDIAPGSSIADITESLLKEANIIILLLSADIDIEQAFRLVESHSESLFVVYTNTVIDDLLELFKSVPVVPEKPISEHKSIDHVLATIEKHFTQFLRKKHPRKRLYRAILLAISSKQ